MVERCCFMNTREDHRKLKFKLTPFMFRAHKNKCERYLKQLRNKYEYSYMHKHVTYCRVPPIRLPNANKRILICSTAAARTAVSHRKRKKSGIFSFSCSMCDWRDMKSECVAYPALWGKRRIGTGTPGIVTKVYRATGIVPVWQSSQKFRVRVCKSCRT